MNVEGTSGVALGGNEEHVIGKWSKDNFYYNVAENLTDLCSTVW